MSTIFVFIIVSDIVESSHNINQLLFWNIIEADCLSRNKVALAPLSGSGPSGSGGDTEPENLAFHRSEPE